MQKGLRKEKKRKSNTNMKKLLKFIVSFLLVMILSLGIVAGSCYAYVRIKMNENQTSYTDTVENILLDMVPEEGIVIKGKTYDYWKVKSFLDEIRYDPYNYEHKDHHCIIQYMDDGDVHRIVGFLRLIMGVW